MHFLTVECAYTSKFIKAEVKRHDVQTRYIVSLIYRKGRVRDCVYLETIEVKSPVGAGLALKRFECLFSDPLKFPRFCRYRIAYVAASYRNHQSCTVLVVFLNVE